MMQTASALSRRTDGCVIWMPERSRHQRQLVAELYRRAAGAGRDRSAVMVGGLRGADKAAVIEQAGIDRSRYLTVSVDVVLEEMAARSLIPVVARLAPLEAADLVHAEAQFIGKRLALLALACGTNVILDISMVSRPSVRSWIEALRSASYSINGVYVDISVEESVRRCDARHRHGVEAYRSGQGYGGRYVPPEAIRALAAPEGPVPAGPDAAARHAAAGCTGFPAGEVIALIAAYRNGRITLDDLACRIRNRRWPPTPPTCPLGLAEAQAAIDDLEPYTPRSFDDVVLACDLGQITDADYSVLVEDTRRRPCA